MLPHEEFTIATALDGDRVCKRLLEVVEPVQMSRRLWDIPDKPYEGEIGDRTFRISRILNNRNSFAPLIIGRIKEQGTGSQIEIEMKLHPFVKFFILFWLGAVGIGCIGVAIAILSRQRFELPLLIPYGMFIFGALLPFVGFKPEAHRSKQFLINLFPD
ncbi:hypothetical protein BH720_000690 [Desertifilum tharense IPPAS B-1220]|uniref:Uncharacterized protein n=2 Tax=Desertifilum tharense IPPAS B-1220 TaxID=1781255 RepID=A0A1E5QGR7_9CYAN|nr:hypothetical protein [Desertifilum tharense]OEJ73784.1 hypothetical protein BH720_17960 [Desertifilum tharense IPPAS B-1220]